MRVLAHYMSQTEGPLWKAVRGEGNAYGAEIGISVDDHFLYLSLFRSAQLDKAYDQAKNVIVSVELYIDDT